MSMRLPLIVVVALMASIACAANKDAKKTKTTRPTVRAYHKDVLGAAERQHAITVSVRGDGNVSGTVYAIYKMGGGGSVYTCKTETIGSADAKKAGKKKGGKKKTKASKTQKNKDEKEKTALVKTFNFPHSIENGTYVDFVVEVGGGKDGSQVYGGSLWTAALPKLKGNAGSTFNSRGESADANAEGTATIDKDSKAAAIRMRRHLELQRQNKKVMDEVNGK